MLFQFSCVDVYYHITAYLIPPFVIFVNPITAKSICCTIKIMNPLIMQPTSCFCLTRIQIFSWSSCCHSSSIFFACDDRISFISTWGLKLTFVSCCGLQLRLMAVHISWSVLRWSTYICVSLLTRI
jgi:hypothetical protein